MELAREHVTFVAMAVSSLGPFAVGILIALIGTGQAFFVTAAAFGALYRDNPAAWRALASRTGEVTLCCYCKTAHRCHRRLLAEMLVAVGRRLGLEVSYQGERSASV